MIHVKSVKKHFGDVKAVDGLDFSVADGRFLGFLGPNGAGKTTTIRMMIGLLDPSEGSITYDGVEMGKDQIDIKKKIGVVSQHINLDKELTVEENMFFAGKLYHLKKAYIKERSEELLKLLGLSDVKNRVTKHLSGGMKRKLMIAKALMHDPDYLFLDEPTVGIDVHARKEIWKFLRSYHKKGKTIILTTHYIEEAEQLCDWVLLINKGKVFKENTSKALIDEIGHYKVETQDDMYFFDSVEQAKAYAKNIEDVYNITTTSLEDVFYKYTQEEIQWK